MFLPVEEGDIPTVVYIWCCFPGIYLTSFVANSPKFFIFFPLSNFNALCTINLYCYSCHHLLRLPALNR